MPKPFVPIIMGSKTDLSHAEEIGNFLKEWNIEKHYRTCSAHKHSEYLIDIVNYYDSKTDLSIVYITIAGRSDGLSGTLAGHTTRPVIACPPYSDKYGGTAVSSFYMPSNVPVAFIPEPKNAALAAIRIFALNDNELDKRLHDYMMNTRDQIEADDLETRKK